VDRGGLSLGISALSPLAMNVLRVTFTLVPYAALTFFLAVVSRSTMVAIGVGLGYSLLVENLLVETLSMVSAQAARLTRFFPTMLTKSIMQVVTGDIEVSMGMQVPGKVQLLDPNVAALLLAVYTLVFLALALWFFRQQDVTV